MLVGYARVSTLDQDHRLQFDALKKAGVKKIYSEKISAVSGRPELHRLLDALKFGDELVVYKLDRLARSVSDLLDVIRRLDLMACTFRSLTEPIDTATPIGRLMLQVLGAVAEFERSLIRERSMAGQAAARARGVQMGRPSALDAADRRAVAQLWESGHYTLRGVAHVFGVHESVIKRVVYAGSRHGLKQGEVRSLAD